MRNLPALAQQLRGALAAQQGAPGAVLGQKTRRCDDRAPGRGRAWLAGGRVRVALQPAGPVFWE